MFELNLFSFFLLSSFILYIGMLFLIRVSIAVTKQHEPKQLREEIFCFICTFPYYSSSSKGARARKEAATMEECCLVPFSLLLAQPVLSTSGSPS